MSSTKIFSGLPEDSRSCITISDNCDIEVLHMSKRSSNISKSIEDNLSTRVPNAPKSSIGEIFNGDTTDSPVSPKNGISRPRVVRDTPTRPRDTHSRLFGQVDSMSPPPMVTNTIRSNIKFGTEGLTNGNSTPAQSPSKPLTNGSASSSSSRGELDSSEHSSFTPPRRNPVTGDGVHVPATRRPHPAANLREGNPITGDGYKSMNGEINMVTGYSFFNNHIVNHRRVPPGGFSSGLW